MTQTHKDLPEASGEESAPLGNGVAYDKWVRGKIEHALREAEAHPDKRIPQAEIWRRFGIEH